MNHLYREFSSRGLTVIGVTDEPATKVEPYIQKNGIQYIIALDSGRSFNARAIPHAWLVSPEGKIVWEGHPMGLKDAVIEKHLPGVKR